MDSRLLEEAAQEWESYARDLDDWKKKNQRQATRYSSREAREAWGDARRLHGMLSLANGLEVSLVCHTLRNEKN